MNDKIIATIIVCLTIITSIVSIGIPSPPEILEIKCGQRTAILYWSPTGEESVSEYKIQYKTNWEPNKWIDYPLIQLTTKETPLFLSPWANYTFRVRAVNNAGASNYSGVSDTCSTEEDIPHKHPEDVYGRGNGPQNLMITWNPMPPLQQNAPGFYYAVYWKPHNEPNADWNHRNIPDWQQHRLLIENLPKLRPFLIKVEAHNSLGMGKGEAQPVIGFSDEDKPSDEPKLLKVVKIIDGKSAQLNWTAVEPKSLNGHFKGYKVWVWTDAYENKTEQIVSDNTTTAVINIFTPGKINNAVVLAFNGRFDGPPSDALTLDMPEDVLPDPPSFVWQRIRDQSNKAVIRITLVPNMTNNNPGEKIYIRYRKKGIDTLDNWQNTFKENVEGEQVNDLVNLDFEVFYEVQVVTESGKLSSFSNISTIDTHSYKWPTPSTTTTTTPSTTTSTQSTVPSSTSDFEPRKDTEETNREDTQNLDDNPENGSSKTPWFVAVVCVLAFICIFVGVFVYLKRRKVGAHEVNRRVTDRNNQNKTITTNANNGNGNGLGPIRPNERDSFIVIDNTHGVGHDEPDEEPETQQNNADTTRVYRGTTQTNH